MLTAPFIECWEITPVSYSFYFVLPHDAGVILWLPMEGSVGISNIIDKDVTFVQGRIENILQTMHP